jgi:Tfp pilus assembly protein PilV
VIEFPGFRRGGLAGRLRDDSGLGLVELLIALLVLNIGIFATLAAFTSGALALNRASHISTAAAISDNVMECFRDTSYDNITWPLAAGTCTALTFQTQPDGKITVTGPDGRTYAVDVTFPASSQTTQTPSGAPYPGTTFVKVAQVTVSNYNADQVPADNNVLVTSSSTFSQCAQDMTPTACQS